VEANELMHANEVVPSAVTVDTARAHDLEARRQRADRILNVAADLLQRWGYKRLTMDDVAAQADIGKGTIYQHWRTREALFQAVLERELAALILDLDAAVRSDPSNALPHRMGRLYYVSIMERPILRALFTLNLDVLGKLTRFHTVHESQLNTLRHAFIEMLQEHGVVRADIPPRDLAYAFRTIILGFFLTEPLFSDDQPDIERKADLLALTLKGAFGLQDSPPQAVLRRLAEQVHALMTKALEQESFRMAAFLPGAPEDASAGPGPPLTRRRDETARGPSTTVFPTGGAPE
jgi:AcrR family transcriptional regulator